MSHYRVSTKVFSEVLQGSIQGLIQGVLWGFGRDFRTRMGFWVYIIVDCSNG